MDCLRNQVKKLWCRLVAHETAHEWFYAVVGNDQYREAWLDESFASYELPERYINLSYGEYASDDNYTQAVYRTGCVLLWKLRETLGKETFDTFIGNWYVDNAFSEVTTD